MASIIDVSSLTLNTREAEDLSKVIFEKTWEDNAMNTLHVVETGIVMQEQIPIVGKLDLLGESISECDMPDEAVSIPMSEKVWDPKDWGFRATHCQSDLNKLFKLFKRNARRYEMDDLTGTELGNFMAFIILRDVVPNIQRVIDFSATNITNVGAGSGSETLKAGVATKYFTTLSGLWDQIFTSDTTNSNAYRVTISENAEATKALQATLGATFAYDLFKSMFDKADERLLVQPDLQLEVTSGIFENYINWLESTSQAFTLENTIQGFRSVQFRGVNVIDRKDWSRNIKYFDDGTVYDKPNRALLSTASNKPVGTPDTDSLSHLESYYWKKDRKNYMDFIAGLDVKYLEDYMGVSAY